jgi:hypothetical protein
MSTVHATATLSTSRRTTVRSRRKKPEPIACSECGGTMLNRCWCLSETRLYRETVPLLPDLIKSVRGVSPSQSIVYLAARRKARQALEQIVSQEEQREREQAAYRAFVQNLFENPHPRFAASRDREILEHLLGTYRRYHSIRTLDEVAAAWHRPVAYVRDLRDRCLEALRHWPAEKATGGRRAVA